MQEIHESNFSLFGKESVLYNIKYGSNAPQQHHGRLLAKSPFVVYYLLFSDCVHHKNFCIEFIYPNVIALTLDYMQINVSS